MRFVISVLALVLAASLAVNWVAIRQTSNFYKQMNAVRLDPFGLEAFPEFPTVASRPIILFYGDSRARQWIMPETFKAGTVINRGIGNQTTAQVLGRFPEHAAAVKADVMVLQVGVNDLKTIALFPGRKEAIVQTCTANLSRLVRQSVSGGARVILTTIMPLGRVPIERRPFWSDDVAAAIQDVNLHIASLAGERVTVFDTGRILANSSGMVDPRYSRDLLHLKPEGYTALNQELIGLLTLDTHGRQVGTTKIQ